MLSQQGLRPACPSCGWKFRSLPRLHVATTVHGRTCRNPKCRERWRLIVAPLPTRVEDMEVHVVELIFLGRPDHLSPGSA